MSGSEPEIKEAYRDYNPPVNATDILRKLLASAPDQFVRGLDCVVLTNLSGQPRRKRLGKTTSRGRRIPQARVAGRYHGKWNGQPPWIELYVDQILKPSPRWALWFPPLRDFAIAETFYHELGHHIHFSIRPEFQEKEDVADKWGRRFTKEFIRRKYWYLAPLGKLYRLIRRKE